MWEDILKKGEELEYPTQFVLLGQTYLLKGKYNKAIQAYHKALRIDKNRPKAQLFLGNAWRQKAVNAKGITGIAKKKCLRNAAKHYDKAERLSPESIVGEWARRQKNEIENDKT